MAICLQFVRGNSAPTPRVLVKDTKEGGGTPSELLQIIKDVGAREQRVPHIETERRPVSSTGEDSPSTPTEILQIIKDVGARERRLSVKEMGNRPRSRSQSDLKSGEGVQLEIQKIFKEIGTREPEANLFYSDVKNGDDAKPEINQIIKEVRKRERLRAHSNPEEQPSSSKRSSFAFLRRSRSVVTPNNLPPIPEVIVVSPAMETKAEMMTETRIKRSASAPTPPSNDLFNLEVDEPLPPIRPSHPSFTSATSRQRSPSLGQYSLFPKTSSPRTSPKVRPRAFAPPVPPLPVLEAGINANKPAVFCVPSLQINSHELRKPQHAPKLSLTIPQKAHRPTPTPEPEVENKTETLSRPSSTHSSSSRKSSKRVTFSETADEVISTTWRKCSNERRSSPPHHAPWSSVSLLTALESHAQAPSLSRTASMPTSLSPARTKSILRRTSSFHNETPEQEKQTPEQCIEENPMMVKNLKRLPRRNTRKSQPLPALPTPPETPNPRQSEASRYVRHPVIIPASLPSPPSSITSSSFFSSSDSVRSSHTSASIYSLEDAMFKTITEPIRFAEPRSALISSSRRETVPPTAKSLYWGSEDTNTMEKESEKKEEGMWLKRRGSYGGVVRDAPPVPPVPSFGRVTVM